MATKFIELPAVAANATFLTLPIDLPMMPAISRTLSRFDRLQLEGFIAVAIELLDVADANCDLEDDDPAEDDDISEDDDPGEDVDPREDDDPAEDSDLDRCMAGDDGCGAFTTMFGETAWGSEHERLGVQKLTYGVDQSRGPILPSNANPAGAIGVAEHFLIP